MTIEDRLRDALHDAGDRLDVPEQHLPGGGRRRSMAPGALVVLAAAAILAIALLAGRSAPHDVKTGPAPSPTTTSVPTTTDEPLLFGWYERAPEEGLGRTWGIDATGARIRLPDSSLLALGADRRTVLVSGPRPEDGSRAPLLTHDLRTGAEREIGLSGIVAVASDGQLAVGDRESDAIDITTFEPGTLAQTNRIVLGPRAEVFSMWALAWDSDRAHLLAVTWDTEDQTRWWRVDAVHGTVQELVVPDGMSPGQHGALFVGRATGPVGDFPVLAGRGWGTLHVADDGTTSFEPGRPYGLELPPEGAREVVPVGRVAVQQLGGGRFSFGPGDEEAYLVVSTTDPLHDRFAVSLQTQSGTRTRLVDDVQWVFAP